MTTIISRSFPLIRRTFFFCLVWIGIFFLLELKVVSNNIVWQPSLTRFENQSESFNVTITNTSTKIVFVNGTTRVIANNNLATTSKPTTTTTTSRPTTITTTKITIPTTTPTKSTSRPTTINTTTQKTTTVVNKIITTNIPTTVVKKIIPTNIPTTVATNSTTTKPVCFYQANFSSPSKDTILLFYPCRICRLKFQVHLKHSSRFYYYCFLPKLLRMWFQNPIENHIKSRDYMQYL